MGRTDYLAMKTDQPQHLEVVESDFQQLKIAAKKFANDALKLGGGLALGTSILQYVAAIAAIYLLIIDRTNWKSNMLTGLLVPYIFLTIPTFLFHLFRGEVGKWIAFVAVVVKLFIPRQVPEWVEMLASIILLLVVTPNLLADHVRGNMIGVFVCLVIGCYLLQEHIRASGGFKNAFTKSSGISNTIGIVLLFVYPVWALVLWIL